MSDFDNIYLPVIRLEDFESFRSLMHAELPPTYDEWTKRHADRVAYWRRTNRIFEIQINPNEFAAFIRKSGRGANMKNLSDFAAIIGERDG